MPTVIIPSHRLNLTEQQQDQEDNEDQTDGSSARAQGLIGRRPHKSARTGEAFR
jgi:hypothetical protein